MAIPYKGKFCELCVVGKSFKIDVPCAVKRVNAKKEKKAKQRLWRRRIFGTFLVRWSHSLHLVFFTLESTAFHYRIVKLPRSKKKKKKKNDDQQSRFDFEFKYN